MTSFNLNQLIRALCLMVICVGPLLHAQTGRVYDNLSMSSKILDSERKYAIYLPPDYDSSERSYPVLYLLHGSGDDQTGWIQFGEVLHFADNAIDSGAATAMVIVMPDASAGMRGYRNDLSGKWRYEDFFFEEFMPFVEKKYRIKGQKRYRAVAGLSMGGDGTYTYALHRPDLFSSACPLSAVTGPRSVQDIRDRVERYSIDSAMTFSDARVEEYFKRYSAVYQVEHMPEEHKKGVRWYIDCGDDDYLYEGNSLIHIAMKKNDIPHEYRVRDGGHSWTYWRESLPEVLRFISDTFHQH